jgi:hypothetical protein
MRLRPKLVSRGTEANEEGRRSLSALRLSKLNPYYKQVSSPLNATIFLLEIQYNNPDFDPFLDWLKILRRDATPQFMPVGHTILRFSPSNEAVV